MLKCQCSIVSKFAYTLFLCYKVLQILTNAKCHAYMISVLRIRVSLVKNYLIYNHSLFIQKLRQINDFSHFRDMPFSGHNVTPIYIQPTLMDFPHFLVHMLGSSRSSHRFVVHPSFFLNCISHACTHLLTLFTTQRHVGYFQIGAIVNEAVI